MAERSKSSKGTLFDRKNYMQQRRPVRHHYRGMGWPILPDSFNAASGGFMSFSPNTADATIMQILTSQGQQLPPDLAAKWAAAQSGQQSSGAAGSASSSPAAAVSASGQPLSTQTGASVGVKVVAAIAPGVFLWTMTDGSSHYADASGNPVSYTPPPPVPVVTPAASQPTQSIVPAITGNPADGTSGGLMTSNTGTPMPPPIFLGPPVPAPVGTAVPAVTPSGVPISSTNGQPQPVNTTLQPSSDIMLGTFDLTAFLTGSIITGVPNWLLIAGGAAAFFMFSGGSSTSRRR
jgi:hypothetical protein